MYGQIGNNSTLQALVPGQVQGLSDVTAIAGGYVTSAALRADGTVWGWGYNGFGQLGNGTTVDSRLPVQAQGLSGVTAIAAGIFHLVALKADGTVWGSGYNGGGQLGNNSTVDAWTPVQAAGLSGVTTVAAGGYHTLALRSDASVVAFGYNSYGQLGIGTTTDVRVPQTVTALAGTKALAAGLYNSLAVRADGSVQGSGLNGNGAVGDGTLTDRPTPATALGYNQISTPLASYTYDGTGARTAKTVAGVRTTFAWDGAHSIPQLLNETNTTTGAVTSYIYGPDGLPLEQTTGSTVTWLHHDQLGSTRLLTNNTGATVGTFTYDPYGNTTTQTGPATTNLRYAGEYTDNETGLIYLRARYYDPSTAQFLTRDPLVGRTREAYGYTAGNPLNATDPSGMALCLGPVHVGNCSKKKPPATWRPILTVTQGPDGSVNWFAGVHGTGKDDVGTVTYQLYYNAVPVPSASGLFPFWGTGSGTFRRGSEACQAGGWWLEATMSQGNVTIHGQSGLLEIEECKEPEKERESQFDSQFNLNPGCATGVDGPWSEWGLPGVGVGDLGLLF